MKKLISILLVLFVLCTVLVACTPNNPDPQSYTMVAPDGAPALAISELMAKNMQFDNNFTYKVVGANDIKTHVVGNVNAHADFALLPINLASLLLGDGDEYKMVAVVTHGNLYFLSQNDTQITLDNASTQLKGKSIAVVNLAAVPGLTTKALLTKVGLAYTEDESQRTDDNVFLKGIDGSQIAASLKGENAVDYVVAPEPAVSTITGKAPVIKKVGALHDVYGRYPQAVLVVKSSIIETNVQLVKDVVNAIKGATDYVKANTQDAVDAVASHLPEGTTPSFNANNTTASSVDGCGINIKTLDDTTLLTQIETYINDIIAVNATSANVLPQTFLVNINKVK